MTKILKMDSKGPPFVFFFQMTKILKIDRKGPPLFFLKIISKVKKKQGGTLTINFQNLSHLNEKTERVPPCVLEK